MLTLRKTNTSTLICPLAAPDKINHANKKIIKKLRKTIESVN
jgi:hypothetical protein